MKSLTLALLLVCGTALSAGPLPADAGDLEPIHLFKIANGVVSIGVATSGSTSEQYFKVEVRKDEQRRTCIVRIVRIKRDEGKMMPQPLVITYRLEDLKIDPRFEIKVENPFCSEER